jgi:hypothetical protein
MKKKMKKKSIHGILKKKIVKLAPKNIIFEVFGAERGTGKSCESVQGYSSNYLMSSPSQNNF